MKNSDDHGACCVLVSACLLNRNVRYNAEPLDYSDEFLEKIKKVARVIPFCPEVEAGLGVPRVPVELSKPASEVLEKKSGLLTKHQLDVTIQFLSSFEKLKKILSEFPVKFAVLKENSPSCGVHFVYDGTFSGNIMPGNGLLSEYLKQRHIVVFSDSETEQCYRTISGQERT